jgi:hypothetical protein
MITFEMKFSDGTEINLELLEFKPPEASFEVEEIVDEHGNNLKMAKKRSLKWNDWYIKTSNDSVDAIKILKDYSIKEHLFDGLVTIEENDYKLSKCILKSIDIDESSTTLCIVLGQVIQESIE